MDHPSILQIIFGCLTLVTALCVVVMRNPVISAVMLMATLFLTGALYLGMGAYFIGAVQILIYAGAIAVLFVFIVMLLELKPFFLRIPGRKITAALAGIAALAMIGGLALTAIPASNQSEPAMATSTNPVAAESSAESGDSTMAQATGPETVATAEPASPKTISLQFLSKYMLPYQVTGLLILAAVMGVVVLGRPRQPREDAQS